MDATFCLRVGHGVAHVPRPVIVGTTSLGFVPSGSRLPPWTAVRSRGIARCALGRHDPSRLRITTTGTASTLARAGRARCASGGSGGAAARAPAGRVGLPRFLATWAACARSLPLPSLGAGEAIPCFAPGSLASAREGARPTAARRALPKPAYRGSTSGSPSGDDLGYGLERPSVGIPSLGNSNGFARWLTLITTRPAARHGQGIGPNRGLP